MRKIRWTVTCDKVVLHDAWSPYNQFTIVPFFCYFRRGRPFGIVRNLLSPQEQLNKIASQELHIVNTTANSGWMVEAGSLVGMTADDLEEHGAETGLTLIDGIIDNLIHYFERFDLEVAGPKMSALNQLKRYFEGWSIHDLTVDDVLDFAAHRRRAVSPSTLQK